MANTIEGPLVRVPYEALKRTTRDRKYVLDELESTLKDLEAKASTQPKLTQQQAFHTLDDLIVRFNKLKRKLVEIGESEAAEAHRCRVRLQHLQQLGTPAKEHVLSWNRSRMDRLLADYMLRAGYLRSAASLSNAANIADLTDTHIFAACQPILDALDHHNCTPALEWCAANRARLKKGKSKLEFSLRVQEFVELVRQGATAEAIPYARTHLAPWSSMYLEDMLRAFALVVMARADIDQYQALLDPQRWTDLKTLFCRELYRLHSMPPTSLLQVHLEAGLSALKTPKAFEEGSTKEDPLHHPGFRNLAQGLPFSKHVHSKLLCSITREIMNEHNPPMALPNGYVYSEKAVQLGAVANGGRFVDPKSGDSYPLSDIRRVYIS